MEHDPEEEQAFNKWLRCYYQDGMQNLVDRNGRTIWFAGPPGPMKPSNSKSRGKRDGGYIHMTSISESISEFRSTYSVSKSCLY